MRRRTGGSEIPVRRLAVACLTLGAIYGAVLRGVRTAQATLARHDRPLVARNPRYRVTLGAWMVLYSFVAIQPAWSRRP